MVGSKSIMYTYYEQDTFQGRSIDIASAEEFDLVSRRDFPDGDITYNGQF